jgi:Domain of unknown function (DUF1707)
MSLGPDDGNPSRYPAMLASRADREATQAVLENAFADERLNQDEFEARVGRALSAHTLADLAELTRDLPVAPGQPPAPGQYAVPGPFAGPGPQPRSGRRVWWLVSGIAAVVIVAVIALFAVVSTGGTSPQASVAPGPVTQSVPAAAASSGPARCPVGTSATAVAIANALVTDPLYVNAPAKQVSKSQARRIRARIASDDPGLVNSIASCPADSAGAVWVVTPRVSWMVTSYADYKTTAHAVDAALNTHATLGAGALDAVGRIAALDPGN